MSILEQAINDNSKEIEEDLQFFISDRLICKKTDVDVELYIQGGFDNGWSNVIVFKIYITLSKGEKHLLSTEIEIACLDDFESEVLKSLSELVESK